MNITTKAKANAGRIVTTGWCKLGRGTNGLHVYRLVSGQGWKRATYRRNLESWTEAAKYAGY